MLLWWSCPWCWSTSQPWPITARSRSFQLSETRISFKVKLPQQPSEKLWSWRSQTANIRVTFFFLSILRPRPSSPAAPGAKRLYLSCGILPPCCISCHETVLYWSSDAAGIFFFIQIWPLMPSSIPDTTPDFRNQWKVPSFSQDSYPRNRWAIYNLHCNYLLLLTGVLVRPPPTPIDEVCYL